MIQKILFLALVISSAPHASYAMEENKQEKCPVCWENTPVTEYVHPTCCNSKQAICITCYQKILENDHLCPFCRSDVFSLEKKKQVHHQEPFQRPPSPSLSEKIVYACLLQ